MTSQSTSALSNFAEVLTKFKQGLTEDQRNDFTFTTLEDLEREITNIQNRQRSERKMRNFARLKAFLEGMKQYEEVVKVFLNASGFVAFIWGPMKFLLLVASNFAEAFDALLDAYQQIGESLPLLMHYRVQFDQNPQICAVLGLMYKDILDFHANALKYFQQRMWKQLFHATWNTFKTRFSGILENLRRHRRLIESQANVVQFEQLFQELQRGTKISEAEFERLREEEKLWRLNFVKSWLSPANTNADQRICASKWRKYPMTGRWILDDSLMKAWLDYDTCVMNLLWINGIPGAGKSVLASMIISEAQDLRKSNDVAVVFFYCKYKDPSRSTMNGIARAILVQLLLQNESLLPYLFEKASSSGETVLESPELASELLATAIKSVQKVYVIIDGLDECDRKDKKSIVSWFRSMIDACSEEYPNSLRCLFLSQDDGDTGKLLSRAATITLTKTNTKQDIQDFTTTYAKRLQSKFDFAEDVLDKIIITVTERASGMFLFARLVMKHLKRSLSLGDLIEELKPDKFPQGLDEVYTRIIDRILRENKFLAPEAAAKILGWLACAKRPLKWHEIQGAVSTDLQTQQVDLERRKLRVDAKDLCGSLVERHSDGTVELVHLTAKFFLVDQKHISLLNVEHDLSKLCLGYLTFTHLDESQLDTEIKALALKGAYSFLDYAGIYWMCHLEEWARNTDIADPSIIDLLRRFLQEYWAVSMSKSTASSVRTTFALFAKLDIFVPLLSAVSTWKEQCDIYGTNVLSSDTLKLVDRISRVRAIIEKILIESAGNNGLEQTLYAFYGANLYKCSRLSCRFFEDGFPTAAQRDNHLKKHLRAFTCTQSSCPYAIVGFKTRKELERHASASHSEFNGVSTYPVTRDPKSINVKQAIRQGCDIEEVEKWLEQFPSSDGFSSQIQGAAICAIKNGNQSYVEVLLKGRFLNVANYLNLISIALKAKQDDIAIHIQGLSATSLCVRRTSGPNSDTPIFIAFQEGRVSFIRHVVQIPNVITDLIRHTPEGFVIFQYAIEKNCLSVIRLLIKFWPTEFWLSKNQNGELPAHVAIKAGNAATLRILLESNKCDINPPRDSGETSLHLAAIQGNAAFVQMLLSAGCVLENSQEETISDPARCGYEEVVNILGTYWPSSHDKWLGVAQLHNAAMEGDVEVVQRLLARTDVRIPVDLSHPISGKTPLIAAVDRGHTSVVAQLIARQDVNVNEKAFDEAWHPRLCTPLVVAVIKGYDWIVELLLTRSDIKLHIPYTWQAEGVNSNLNVLEIAHILENEKITKLLLERLEAAAPEAEPDEAEPGEAEPSAAANSSLEERIEIPSNNGSNFNADIFPWTNDNPENILTETAIKQGYYDKMVLQKNETDSGRARLWSRLKDKSGQQELFGLFAAALEMRQRNSRAPSHDAAPSLSEESPKGADLQFELSTAQAAEQLAHSSPQSSLDREMEQDARESSR